VQIFSVIDGVRGPARHDRGEAYLEALDEYYEAARRQSDRDFLLMPNDENSTGGRPPFLGGHYDLLIPHPVYWKPGRNPGQPLTEQHPRFGKVYNLGTPEDLMKMTEEEGALVSLPHPRTKGSTGYPDAIRDEAHFLHPNYFSLGYRWGMGIDASEIRLGEYRFLRLWNETNNWMADRTGSGFTVVAEVEWTFPLEFVEVVWGDGEQTGREVVPAEGLEAFGHHRFEIPFDASGKKWLRFAAWDVAGNGALAQPVSLQY
jgi:hypothetical protein